MAANQLTTLRTEIESLDFLGSPDTLFVFEHAAEQFVKHNNDLSVEIWAASRDWFMEEWGRDTFISVPGLLLSTGKFEDAKQIFSRFSGREHGGLIPNVIKPEESIYNTADGSLLLIHALKEYVAATNDWPFIDQLLPTLKNIISGYRHGTSYRRGETEHEIKMDFQDGLVYSPAQATWMDADPSGNGTAIVTPRNGKCVEINALWYESLRFAMAWIYYM
jgi:predicted glycogen debranching enzyme